MTSSQKIAANRGNAAKSTGPRTAPGKAVSRTNALQHGVLATVAAIDADEQAAFDDLLTALDDDLKPVGPLEEALVEKIALAIWRNRRLAQAERAKLVLQLQEKKIAEALRRDSGYSLSLSDIELEPYDPETAARHRRILDEMSAAGRATVDQLSDVAPTIHDQLVTEAEEEDFETPAAYLNRCFDGGFPEFLRAVASWSRSELAKAEERPALIEAAAQMRDRQHLLPIETQQLVARYQTMLDGQLYKAVRELREAQKQRRQAIDADVLDEIQINAPVITAA